MPLKRNQILKFFSRKGSPAPAQHDVGPSSSTTISSIMPSGTQQITVPLPIQAVTPDSTTLLTQSPSLTVLPSVSPSITPSGNQLNRAPPSTGIKEASGVTWEGLKLALVLLKESSDWLPQLKAATGGLVALIDAIELTSANTSDLETLRQKIDVLTSVIQENSRDRTFPWLRRRLSIFAQKLDEIVNSIDEKSNHGKIRRFAEGKKDKGDITAFATAISDLVTSLQTELSLYTSRGVNHLLSSESLKKLKVSETAHYDALLSTQLVQRRGCTPKTRQTILAELVKWAVDPHSSRMYWMTGMAGTGKTTIAYSFCEQLQEKGLLGANFFCSRSLTECSDIRYIIPTTASQLARSCPQFASALLEVLGGDFQLPTLGNQPKRLLLEPFQHISEPVADDLIIVIDALDECNNGALEVRKFLKLIYDCFVTKTIPLKVFVTSRPEDIISRTITPSPSEWSVVRIHDIEESVVQADIKVYLEDELAEIAEAWGLEDGWPPSTEVDVVVGNADRLFIYAATVIRYVKEDSGDPCARLSSMASTSRVGKGTSQSSSLTTELIDGLYKTILERALNKLNQEESQLVWMTLKLIVCAKTPLTLPGIADLLNASGEFEFEIQTKRVYTTLKLLPSVISIPMDDDGVATTFHASFPDFLFDSHRCGSINHISFRYTHQELARICMHLMDKSLTIDNISGLDRWQSVDAITRKTKIESSGALGYACIYWASHIDTDDEIEGLSTELDRFLTCQLLRWFEVLSLLRRLDIGVEVLQRMRECKQPTLSSKFDDAHNFLKDILDIISVWPSEIFDSALVWAPEQSFVRTAYLKNTSARIVSGQRIAWDACELTIRGHSGPVTSVAISSNKLHVVSGSDDKTVRIWNTLTGEQEHVLREHSREVTSVAVSLDNRHVVSGSRDMTVRIWNAFTGDQEQVLQGHSGFVTSVAVSPDNRHVVSGSIDQTVRIWNVSRDEEDRVLRGHAGKVNSVHVAPDNIHVVSGSDDKTVRIWNASTGDQEHVLQGHSRNVTSVAVSPDNRYVISGSLDWTVRIWNVSTGEQERVLEGHWGGVQSVAVSPDSRRIVSGSWDQLYSIRIWNASTGGEEHILRGHSSTVNSIAFASDNRHVVSGSYDTTIRIWNASPSRKEYFLRKHSNQVASVVVSPDGHHVVSGSYDMTVRIWNASTGEEEHVLRAHAGEVNSVFFSPDNLHVVSGSTDMTVRIWNASTGDQEHTLRGHSGYVNSVVISPDNRHVISGSSDCTVRIWDASTGKEKYVLRGHSDGVYSVAVSPNNFYVVSGSMDKTVRIWNTSTGEGEHVLRGHSDGVKSVAVSPDNRHVVSGSQDNTVQIWNMSSGKSSGEHKPVLVISTAVSDNFPVMPGSPTDTIQTSDLFLSAMVTFVALLAQSDNLASTPLLQRLFSGETTHLDTLLQVIGGGRPLIPIALAPDGLSILLSSGQKCLAIPSAMRDITSAAFSGSKVYLGHDSGRITILDISI